MTNFFPKTINQVIREASVYNGRVMQFQSICYPQWRWGNPKQLASPYEVYCEQIRRIVAHS